MTNENELKHISIRGVNASIYDEFTTKVKDLEINIGEAFTSMMQDVLDDFEETFPKVSSNSLKGLANLPSNKVEHIHRLKVSNKDLEEADIRIRFQHIKELEFTSDVTSDNFEKYVTSIQHCNMVKLPSILPKLKILAKIKHCNDIEVYEVE